MLFLLDSAMPENLIHDRGRGPELIGTRTTVFNLLPYFLDPSVTENYICQMNGVTPEQVAAARAYILHHADTVLMEHLQIEERLAAGNPPEVIERAKKSHDNLLKFKEWLQKNSAGNSRNLESQLPPFKQWLAEQQTAAIE
jgi:hypothetical protein